MDTAQQKNLPKSVVAFLFLRLQAGGQKGICRSSQNSIIFNADFFDFDGSPGIPSEMKFG